MNTYRKPVEAGSGEFGRGERSILANMQAYIPIQDSYLDMEPDTCKGAMETPEEP